MMAVGSTRLDEDFGEWIGRERTSEEVLSTGRARLLAATLDTTPGVEFTDGDPLPPAWHWIYFNDEVARSKLAEDGHERRGGFLPPIPLSRRMWAGGRLRFHAAPRLGAVVRRRSAVRSIDVKEGRAGPLAFVTVGHQLTDEHGLLVEEEQDIVYLDRQPVEGRAIPDGAGQANATTGDWTESIVADEIVLFRFSALTFNAHRIHYDLPYATDVEGYPGLVVHGPLLALLLLGAALRRNHAYRADAPSGTRFAYRAVQPAYCGETLLLRGRTAAGTDSPTATAEFGTSSDPTRAAAAALDLRVDHGARGTVTRASLTVFAPDE